MRLWTFKHSGQERDRLGEGKGMEMKVKMKIRRENEVTASERGVGTGLLCLVQVRNQGGRMFDNLRDSYSHRIQVIQLQCECPMLISIFDDAAGYLDLLPCFKLKVTPYGGMIRCIIFGPYTHNQSELCGPLSWR